MDRYFNCTCDCTDCAVIDCEFVKNAVEKQISKKPVIHYGADYKDMLATCPVCNSNVDWTYEGFWRNGNPKYCKWCGQRIDWDSVSQEGEI